MEFMMTIISNASFMIKLIQKMNNLIEDMEVIKDIETYPSLYKYPLAHIISNSLSE